jgi:hypothetical protein
MKKKKPRKPNEDEDEEEDEDEVPIVNQVQIGEVKLISNKNTIKSLKKNAFSILKNKNCKDYLQNRFVSTLNKPTYIE